LNESPVLPLRIVAESLPQPVWTATAEGRPGGFNGRWYAFTGQSDGDGHGLWDALHPEEVEAHRRRWQEALRTGEGYEAEARLRAADGRYHWFKVKTTPIRDGGGPVQHWLGTCTDIDAQKTATEARQALAREMSHRVKNLFAVASGLVSMTARSAKTPKDMADALRGRLGALSRAHELVRSALGGDEGASEATTLENLVQSVLSPYATGGDRLQVAGPPVPVGTNTVTNLALVLHELAANAAKYGSLSDSQGRLAIRWEIEGDEVRLAWDETGGPALAGAPGAEGFGSQLARRTVTGQLGGTMEPDWRAEGLRLAMTLSLERLAR
jgi:PAS domain S-box-containing protein